MKYQSSPIKPVTLLWLLAFVNLLNFMDRGVIPGASKEFDKFISDNTETDSPDVYLGLLQSSFIVGLLVGSLTFGHMIHYYGRFFLVGGLSVKPFLFITRSCMLKVFTFSIMLY